jgi:protein SCO1
VKMILKNIFLTLLSFTAISALAVVGALYYMSKNSQESSGSGGTGATTSQAETAASKAAPEPLKAKPFKLVGMDQSIFDSASLRGQVWVANFMFSRCQGPCPLTAQKLRILVDEFAKNSDFLAVSISLDPDFDTPAVLAGYALRFPVPPGRWHFLTGTTEAVKSIARDVFRLPAGTEPDMHSTKVAAIDRSGTIRGYFATDDVAGFSALRETVAELLRESSPVASGIGAEAGRM